MRASGLDDALVSTGDAPSTLVLVTKTVHDPDFEVYRGGDQQLAWLSFERALTTGASVFHTTCFALSGLPARSHLLRASAAFAKTGAAVSLDANYAAKVWPDRARARAVVAGYLAHGAVAKFSGTD